MLDFHLDLSSSNHKVYIGQIPLLSKGIPLQFFFKTLFYETGWHANLFYRWFAESPKQERHKEALVRATGTVCYMVPSSW